MHAAARGTIRIGISGWTYARWRGVFYPKGLPHRRELAYAAQCFGSIEINGTFYGLQRPEAFARWRDETPDGFVFAVKGSRYITHMLKLKGHRDAARQLHGVRPAPARSQARTGSVAVSGAHALRCRALRRLLRAAAARHGRGAHACSQARRAARRALLAE
jgi:hypothetical protein